MLNTAHLPLNFVVKYMYMYIFRKQGRVTVNFIFIGIPDTEGEKGEFLLA